MTIIKDIPRALLMEAILGHAKGALRSVEDAVDLIGGDHDDARLGTALRDAGANLKAALTDYNDLRRYAVRMAARSARRYTSGKIGVYQNEAGEWLVDHWTASESSVGLIEVMATRKEAEALALACAPGGVIERGRNSSWVMIPEARRG